MSKFDILDLSILKSYLGVGFLSTDKGLFLTQLAYVQNILAEFAIEDNKPPSVPTP